MYHALMISLREYLRRAWRSLKITGRFVSPNFYIMKKLFLFYLLLSGLMAAGQSKGYLRYDSLYIEKGMNGNAGNAELILRNGSRTVYGGLLTNVNGDGLVRFIKPRVVADTLFLGLDTIIFVSTPSLFARTDARNNTGADMYFSGADKDFVLDSFNYILFNRGTPGVDGSFLELTKNTMVGVSHSGGGSRFANLNIESVEDSIVQVLFSVQSEGKEDALIVGFDDNTYRGVIAYTLDTIYLQHPNTSSDTIRFKPTGIAPNGATVTMDHWPGSGGGSTGWDDMLAVGQTQTANRAVDMGSFQLFVNSVGLYRMNTAGGNRMFELDGSSTAGALGNFNTNRVFGFDIDSLYINGLGIRNDTTNGKIVVLDPTTKRIRLMNWVGSGTTPLSTITAATVPNTIDNLNNIQEWQWSTLSGNGMILSSASTAAAGNAQSVFNVNNSGANGTSAQTTYGARINNTKTGTTSVNVGAEINASGGATNYGIKTDNSFHFTNNTNSRARIYGSNGTSSSSYLELTTVGSFLNFGNSGWGAGSNTLSMSISGTPVAGFSLTSFVINDNSLNYDTRIESDNQANKFFLDASADAIGINQATPTASLHIGAGTATAGTGPLKFTSGTNLTTAEAGVMEYNGANFFLSPTNSNRRQIVLSDVATPANGQIPIGNGTDFTIANITSPNSTISVTNGAGTLGLDIPTTLITSGVYTPTSSSVSGGTVLTIEQFMYSRTGNTVTFSGYVSVDPTAAGVAMDFNLTIPIASNFATEFDAAGVANAALSDFSNGQVYADATNDRITVRFVGGPTSITGCGVRVTGQYVVK